LEKIKLMISRNEIIAKIDELAELINKKYKGQKVVFLGVMNGAFFLMHDLVKKINIDCDYDFLFCSSYYGGTESSGKVSFIYPNKVDIRDRVVIILEDIVDTGKTIEKVASELLKYNPRSIHVSSLFLRKKCSLNFELFWYGYKIKNEFIVGYGLDYDEKYRSLEDIYELEIS